MKGIISWLFSQTRIGQYLDGKKTTIGAILVVASTLLEALSKLALAFPEVAWLHEASTQGAEALAVVTKTLNDLGIGFLSVGLVHKSIKKDEK